MNVYIVAWGMLFAMSHELLHGIIFTAVCLELILLLLLQCFRQDQGDNISTHLAQTPSMPGPLMATLIICYWLFITVPTGL